MMTNAEGGFTKPKIIYLFFYQLIKFDLFSVFIFISNLLS